MENSLAHFLADPANMWLAAGVALVIAEALGLSGVGLMFAGLGAVAVGAAIRGLFIPADAFVSQFILFFMATAVLAGLLWKPLQKFRGHKQSGEYNNIVGETAYVGSNGLDARNGGEVTWSGTIMKAQLAKQAQAGSLDAGSQVVIVGVTGATLIVKPKE